MPVPVPVPVPDRRGPVAGAASNTKPASLASRIANHTSAVDLAGTVVSLWGEIDGALRPIIGQRGVVALFKRSVQMTAREHPWLLSVLQEPNTDLQFSAIADHFARQQTATAVSGGQAMLLAFHQLLSSLIGVSLTERLLQPVFSPANGSPPTQESSS